MLTDSEIGQFEGEGFVVIRGAVPPEVLGPCQAELEEELRRHGVDVNDRATWTEPVVRFWCPDTEPFAEAGAQPILWRAYEQLIGPGRAVAHQGVGGSVPVRFPSAVDPGDAGWHVDGTIPMGDTWGLNVRTAGRGLLCLFLFSDVDLDDAPTEIKVGSHLLIPPTLLPFGEEGGIHDLLRSGVLREVEALPSAFATGRAGDVFVCHPFLVHRATWPHRGTRPRFLAQPAIGINAGFDLTGEGDVYPVERAIIRGLGGVAPDF